MLLLSWIYSCRENTSFCIEHFELDSLEAAAHVCCANSWDNLWIPDTARSRQIEDIWVVWLIAQSGCVAACFFRPKVPIRFNFVFRLRGYCNCLANIMMMDIIRHITYYCMRIVFEGNRFKDELRAHICPCGRRAFLRMPIELQIARSVTLHAERSSSLQVIPIPTSLHDVSECEEAHPMKA